MLTCTICAKSTRIRAWSRHKKGSSGHGGAWNLKAQISKKPQKVNLHVFKGQKYCTSCLRLVKTTFNQAMSKPQTLPPLST